MALTNEQIYEAAEALLSEGINPTLANVRKKLGSGSFSTISEAMSEWKAMQKKPDAPIREAAPESISQRLEEFGSEVWSIALEIANGRLKAEREALEAARIEMEQQQKETAEMADELAAEVEQLRKANEELSLSLESSKITEKRMHEDLTAEKSESVKFKSALDVTEKRVADLQEEIQNTRSLLSQTQQDRDRCMADNQKAHIEVEKLKAEINTAAELHKRDQSAIEQRISLVTAERDQLSNLVSESRSETKSALEEAKEAQIQNGKLSGELEAIRKQLADQAKSLKEVIDKSMQQQPKPKNNRTPE